MKGPGVRGGEAVALYAGEAGISTYRRAVLSLCRCCLADGTGVFFLFFFFF